MLVKVKEIMGNNFERFTLIWNDNLNIYKSLVQNPAFLEKFSNFMIAKLKVKIKPIMEFESLYDVDTSTDILTDMIIDFMMDLLNEGFVEQLMLNEKWVDFDTLGQSNNTQAATGENIMSYSGFAVQNQDGQYSKTNTTNSGNSAQSGGMQRLQYITFLQNTTNTKCTTFIKNIKSNMLKLIY